MLAVASVSFSFAVPVLSARVKNQAHELVGLYSKVICQ